MKIKFIQTYLKNYTLAKFIGAILTSVLVASFKYYISGNLHIEYTEFLQNIGLGLLGWTLNTGLVALFTDYLGIKGFNFNLNQIIFGLNTINVGNEPSPKDFKPKLYNAMDTDSDSGTNKPLDKGKGVDRELHPNYDRNMYIHREDPLAGNKTLDNRTIKEKLAQPPVPFEPPFVTWSKVFPDLDPAMLVKPKGTNPGPGFNVPGGEVPIRDEICKHIDYNTHILNQYKKMDLETAIEQRNNHSTLINVLETKLNYANNVLSNVPVIPTTEYEFRLKNQILKDLDQLNKDKIRAEARSILLSSRIQYIEGQISKK